MYFCSKFSSTVNIRTFENKFPKQYSLFAQIGGERDPFRVVFQNRQPNWFKKRLTSKVSGTLCEWRFVCTITIIIV